MSPTMYAAGPLGPRAQKRIRERIRSAVVDADTGAIRDLRRIADQHTADIEHARAKVAATEAELAALTVDRAAERTPPRGLSYDELLACAQDIETRLSFRRAIRLRLGTEQNSLDGCESALSSVLLQITLADSHRKALAAT